MKFRVHDKHAEIVGDNGEIWFVSEEYEGGSSAARRSLESLKEEILSHVQVLGPDGSSLQASYMLSFDVPIEID